MESENFLFAQEDLRDIFSAQLKTAEKNIDAIPSAQLRGTSTDGLIEHIASQIYIEPLAIYEERMTLDQQEVQIDVQGWPRRNTFRDGPCMVPGIRLIISLPFSGDSKLWKLQPSTFTPGAYPYGNVSGNNLEIIFEQPSDEPPETFQREHDSNLKSIRDYLKWQKDEIEKFNNMVPNHIRSLVEARKQRLSKHDIIAKTINIPLRHDPNAPKFEPVPIQKRIVKPLPPAPMSDSKPEFGITEQDYNNILSLIHHVGRTLKNP
jgi:hypothetical protein